MQVIANDAASHQSIVNTYEPDDVRPSCPDCGCPVEPPYEGDQADIWLGACIRQHLYWYQLEDTTDED